MPNKTKKKTDLNYRWSYLQLSVMLMQKHRSIRNSVLNQNQICGNTRMKCLRTHSTVRFKMKLSKNKMIANLTLVVLCPSKKLSKLK